jgi:hypothetical protein
MIEMTEQCVADGCGNTAAYGLYCSETCQTRDMATMADVPAPPEMFGYQRVETDDEIRFEPID